MIMIPNEQTDEYPQEDKCKYCGQHLGWVTCEFGEMFRLGVCEKPECQEKYKSSCL